MNGVLQGIDVKSMGRIFVGLVKCGAWGCFDEFNRLEEAVLSAVSMQIQAIQNSLKNHRTSCELLGKEVTTHLVTQSLCHSCTQKLVWYFAHWFLKLLLPFLSVSVSLSLCLCLCLCVCQVELDPNSGVFITLNPAGKGYGGRQKLPDNLKQLFRPVAMSRPDNELIAEVILYSEGFKDGEILGRKLVAIFNLARCVFVSIPK